jgi:hypothetical protein
MFFSFYFLLSKFSAAFSLNNSKLQKVSTSFSKIFNFDVFFFQHFTILFSTLSFICPNAYFLVHCLFYIFFFCIRFPSSYTFINVFIITSSLTFSFKRLVSLSGFYYSFSFFAIFFEKLSTNFKTFLVNKF